MNVAMHIEKEPSLSIYNLYKDIDRTQTLNIYGEGQVDLYFKNFQKLKEFSEQLQQAIKEVEK